MKRLAAVIAVSTVLWCCAPLTDVAEAPLPGDKIKDVRAAMETARQTCHVSMLDVWLSPYRWHVERHDGIWHVRVPAMDGSLGHAYVDVDLRADDGTAPKGCVWPFDDTVVIASAN